MSHTVRVSLRFVKYTDISGPGLISFNSVLTSLSKILTRTSRSSMGQRGGWSQSDFNRPTLNVKGTKVDINPKDRRGVS